MAEWDWLFCISRDSSKARTKSSPEQIASWFYRHSRKIYILESSNNCKEKCHQYLNKDTGSSLLQIDVSKNDMSKKDTFYTKCIDKAHFL